MVRWIWLKWRSKSRLAPSEEFHKPPPKSGKPGGGCSMTDVLMILGFLAVLSAPCALAFEWSSGNHIHDTDLYELQETQA
jgi:hypothetical protein